MAKPLALQLYTVRDAAQEDFESTVRKVAEIGYSGV
jgi:sugar phosphate isomerase/epimerase